jgi:transcriptional regulator of acetoin/glycerol metabolism
MLNAKTEHAVREFGEGLARLVAQLLDDLREANEAKITPSLLVDLEEMTSDELTKEQLRQALARHEWNLSAVARRLGVTRRTVYMRMARFGIARKRIPKSARLRKK